MSTKPLPSKYRASITLSLTPEEAAFLKQYQEGAGLTNESAFSKALRLKIANLSKQQPPPPPPLIPKAPITRPVMPPVMKPVTTLLSTPKRTVFRKAIPMPTLPPIHKTQQMVQVEIANGGRDIRLILVDLYNQLGSQGAIAKQLGITQQAIQYWFEKLGISITTVTRAELKTAVPEIPAADVEFDQRPEVEKVAAHLRDRKSAVKAVAA